MTPQQLKDLRLKRGYTQNELGLKIGVSGGYYGKWERGEVTPHNSFLVKLARIYGMDETPYKEDQPVLLTPEEREKRKAIRKHYLDKLAKKYGTDGVLGNFDQVDTTDPDWIAYCQLADGDLD